MTARGEPSWQPISMLATIAELAGELERQLAESDIELGLEYLLGLYGS